MSVHPMYGKRHRGHDRTHRTEAELAQAHMAHLVSRPALCSAYHSLKAATIRWTGRGTRQYGEEVKHPVLTAAKEDAYRLIGTDSDAHDELLTEARQLGILEPWIEGVRYRDRSSPAFKAAGEAGREFYDDHGALLCWLELNGHPARWGVRFERTDTTLNGWPFFQIHIRGVVREVPSAYLRSEIEYAKRRRSDLAGMSS